MPAKAPIAAPLHAPRPRGRPKTEDVQELEDRLISVGRQAFIEKGYGGASMAAIAQAARVSKNTLYTRFPSKADLFRAIIDNQIKRTEARVLKYSPRSKGSMESALRTYGEETMRASLEPETLNINRLIYGEAGRFPELAQVASARHRIGVMRVVDRMRDAADLNGTAVRDIEAAGEIFIDMLRGWYDHVLVTNRSVSEPEIRKAVDRIVQLFMATRDHW